MECYAGPGTWLPHQLGGASFVAERQQKQSMVAPLRGPGRFGRAIRIAQYVGPSGLVAMVIHDIQQHYVLGLLPRYMQLSDNLLGIV